MKKRNFIIYFVYKVYGNFDLKINKIYFFIKKIYVFEILVFFYWCSFFLFIMYLVYGDFDY